MNWPWPPTKNISSTGSAGGAFDDLLGDLGNKGGPVVIVGRIKPVDDDIRAARGIDHRVFRAIKLANLPTCGGKDTRAMRADLAATTKDKNCLGHLDAPS